MLNSKADSWDLILLNDSAVVSRKTAGILQVIQPGAFHIKD